MDSLVIIPNERLKLATDQKITMVNAFEIADDVLQQAVQSISDLIKNTGFINLDFADVSAVMKDAGRAHMGVGRAAGKNKAEEAAKMAISSPLLETSINGAKGVLINVTGSMDIGLEEVETAANLVQEAAHPEANIIFGAAFDDTLEDELRVTVIATGFDEVESSMPSKPFTQAGAKVEEKKAGEPAAPVEEPAPAQEKAVVSDDDWDILGVFFTKKLLSPRFMPTRPAGPSPGGFLLGQHSAFRRRARAAQPPPPPPGPGRSLLPFFPSSLIPLFPQFPHWDFSGSGLGWWAGWRPAGAFCGGVVCCGNSFGPHWISGPRPG